MWYLDHEGSTFVSLRAEHRVHYNDGLTSISKARRMVELRDNKICREISSPVQRFLLRWADGDLQTLDCGIFIKDAKDPTVFPLNLRDLEGMKLEELKYVKSELPFFRAYA